MNYRLIHKEQRRFSRTIPLIFLGLIALFYFFYPTVLGQVAADLAAPFLRLERSIATSVKSLIPFFSSKEKLTSEIDRLSDELYLAGEREARYKVLLEDHAAMREMLGRTDRKENRVVGAVLSRPPRSLYDTLILDAGSADGVKVGDFVGDGSIVIGTVGRVTRNTSVAVLFSDSGMKTAVEILHGGKAIPVEAGGEGGGVFFATLPKQTAVAVGDPVVIPGINPYAFAEVASVESDDTDSFALIRFKSPISLQEVRFLEVIFANRSEL